MTGVPVDGVVVTGAGLGVDVVVGLLQELHRPRLFSLASFSACLNCS